MKIPVISAGQHPTAAVFLTDSMLIDCVHTWSSKYGLRAKHAKNCYGIVSDYPSVKASAALPVSMSNATHYTRMIWFDNHTATIEAHIELLPGSGLDTLPSNPPVFLWRVPILTYTAGAKPQIELVRIDLYKAQTPFSYPWSIRQARGGTAEDYERAMKALG